MRPPIAALFLAALPAAAAAALPAPDQAGLEQAQPPIVRNPDGSFTITRTILPIPEELDGSAEAPFRADQTDRASPGPGGEPRSRSEEEADEDLDEAYEEAVDMARQDAGPD